MARRLVVQHIDRDHRPARLRRRPHRRLIRQPQIAPKPHSTGALIARPTQPTRALATLPDETCLRASQERRACLWSIGQPAPAQTCLKVHTPMPHHQPLQETMTDPATPHRPCIMLVNASGLVFVGKRIDQRESEVGQEGDFWQMPQGGSTMAKSCAPPPCANCGKKPA
jgi:hypothetical protein